MGQEKEIAGILGLDSGNANDLLHGLNLTNQNFKKEMMNRSSPIRYFISNDNPPIIVIASSTKINHANDRNTAADNYFYVVEEIFKNESIPIEEQSKYHIIAPVQTLGIFESHITTCYQAPNANPIVFDSKINDSEVFLQAGQHPDDPNAPKIPAGAFDNFLHVVKGIFRALFYPHLKIPLSVVKGISLDLMQIQSFEDLNDNSPQSLTLIQKQPEMGEEKASFFIFDPKKNRLIPLNDSRQLNNLNFTEGKLFVSPSRNSELYKQIIEKDIKSGPQTVDYETLGTQSFWDSVSCGFHYLANAKIMIDLIRHRKPVNSDSLLSELDAKPAPIVAEKDNLNQKRTEPNEEDQKLTTYLLSLDEDTRAKIQLGIEKSKKQFNTSYAAFIRSAWYSTFRPLTDDPKQEKTFAQYFLGQPKASATLAEKIAYVVLLGWVFTPLINLLKIPTEFALKALAETFNFFRHQIYQRCPTSVPGQYLRSFALGLAHIGYGVFTGLHLITRTVTSPITSAKAGFKKNKALGVLSIATSIILISALIVIALPLLGIVIGAKLAGASTLLSQVASAPVLPYLATATNSLLGLLGIATTPTLIATAILSAGAAITVGINSIREELSDGGVKTLRSAFASIFNKASLFFETVQMTSEQQAMHHQETIKKEVEDFDPDPMKEEDVPPDDPDRLTIIEKKTEEEKTEIEGNQNYSNQFFPPAENREQTTTEENSEKIEQITPRNNT